MQISRIYSLAVRDFFCYIHWRKNKKKAEGEEGGGGGHVTAEMTKAIDDGSI